jgi:DNA-binding NtrC family response regulator
MKKILIVDDEKSIRESYQAILENDYITVTAATTKEALEILDNSFDLVLTDYDLKELNFDGKWLASRIKEIFNGRITVILISGAISGISNTEKETLGICDFLAKPFDIDVFSDMVTKYLR